MNTNKTFETETELFEKVSECKWDVLYNLEQIAEMAHDSRLDDAFFQLVDRYLVDCSERLGLGKTECALLAIFLNSDSAPHTQLRDLARYTKCSNLRLLRFGNSIDTLEQRGWLIGHHGDGEQYYWVPQEVLDALKRNEPYQMEDWSGLDTMDFFDVVAKLMARRNHSDIPYDLLVDQVNRLMDSNPNLNFVKNLKSYDLGVTTEMVLLSIAHMKVNEDEDYAPMTALEALNGDSPIWRNLKYFLQSGTSVLTDLGLVEYRNSEGYFDNEGYGLSRKGRKQLLGDLRFRPQSQSAGNNLLQPRKIIAKPLFYSNEVKAQIDELGQLLREKEYRRIRSRLSRSGLRCGFCCLFYGAPGTGKTETVLQLAKQTGRSIMQVNLSEIRCKWVGESEKNIQEVFDNYAELVSGCKKVPILLFNEADGIINRRKEGSANAVEKMENTIQNIILQEMEDFEGILIATTNLSQNMDKAFERRFLYKVKFEKPTVEARRQMWKSMIPELSGDEAGNLSAKYDFSGGQIENVARLYTIGKILHGEPDRRLDDISVYCDRERIGSDSRRPVGF